MQALTSKQKKYLKAQANSLKPLLQIGKAGVIEQVVQSIHTMLEQHELIKIKFIAFKEEKNPLVEEIISQTASSFVSTIGHVVTLYREQEDPQKRAYRLP